MVFARVDAMAARYLEAMQCLNLIAPERLAEALKIADARVGRQSFQEGCDSGLVKWFLRCRTTVSVVPVGVAKNGGKVRASHKYAPRSSHLAGVFTGAYVNPSNDR